MGKPSGQDNVTSGFFDSDEVGGVQDRAYNALQMSSIFDGVISDGIFSTIGSAMKVSKASSGLAVNVGTGRAWFNHTWTAIDTSEVLLALDPLSVSTRTRIDTVVLVVGTGQSDRENWLEVKKGAEVASNPTPPSLTPDPTTQAGQYWYPLANVTLNSGATAANQNFTVTDRRNTEQTPFVTALLEQIAIEDVIDSWNERIDDAIEGITQEASGEISDFLSDSEDSISEWISRLPELSSSEVAELLEELTPVVVEYTLSHDGWYKSSAMEHYQYVIPKTDFSSIWQVTNGSFQEILLPVYYDGTVGGLTWNEVAMELNGLNIVDGGQNANGITLVALNAETMPELDLPIRLIFRRI